MLSFVDHVIRITQSIHASSLTKGMIHIASMVTTTTITITGLQASWLYYDVAHCLFHQPVLSIGDVLMEERP